MCKPDKLWVNKVWTQLTNTVTNGHQIGLSITYGRTDWDMWLLSTGVSLCVAGLLQTLRVGVDLEYKGHVGTWVGIFRDIFVGSLVE